MIKINPDSDKVNDIRQAIEENGGYCPCVIEQNEDTKCICKQFRNTKTEGYCCCGLYYKIKKELLQP